MSKAIAGAAAGAAAAALSGVKAKIALNAKKTYSKISVEISKVADITCAGIKTLGTLSKIMGSNNGASDLMQTALNRVLENKVGKLIKKVVTRIVAAHELTHPLYLELFNTTWLENLWWVPEHIEEEFVPYFPPQGGPFDALKLIPEYLDFV